MLIDADLIALNDPVTLTHDLLNRFRGTVRRTIPLTGFRFFARPLAKIYRAQHCYSNFVRPSVCHTWRCVKTTRPFHNLVATSLYNILRTKRFKIPTGLPDGVLNTKALLKFDDFCCLPRMINRIINNLQRSSGVCSRGFH